MLRIREIVVKSNGEIAVFNNEEIHIKQDENSGVKWVPVDEILKVTSEI